MNPKAQNNGSAHRASGFLKDPVGNNTQIRDRKKKDDRSDEGKKN